ncbi:murein DD-endopeptidase MepM [mine drainage metagenome]|uniref:Murein DD-endopeptidase MepM n=1 Tax=mine drainage metagenome TaxID=410659 RepID=A0A1J5PKW7_9ZZZZ
MADLQSVIGSLERLSDERTNYLTGQESRLFELKMKQLMIPTQRPVTNGDIGSGFGWRIDPITGQRALHTGLDFPASIGTPILAAAGGIVVAQEFHPEYGNMIEIDHGNDLITRYAHTSKVFVKKGDLVRRGQEIAEVGNTGRTTGPHLHFEVWVHGVAQDPEKFLLAGQQSLGNQLAKAGTAATHIKPLTQAAGGR